MLAVFAAVIIALMALGVSGGGNIIMLVVLLIIYGLFSVCGVYPQGTNIMKKPESASDRDYHREGAAVSSRSSCCARRCSCFQCRFSGKFRYYTGGGAVRA